MRPTEWNIDPEIIKLFGIFPLKYYGLLFVLGIILAYRITKHIYSLENVASEKLEKLFTFLMIGIFAGMRLGHCLFYDFEYYSDHILEIFLPFTITNERWHFTGYTGLASHGGSLGAIIAIILYCRKYKTPVLWVLDRIAVATPILGACIRFGNFMNSEIYGKPTDGNYGVIFMRDDMIPRHPTQLYEAFSYLVIFGLLWYLYIKTNVAQKQGFLLGTLLAVLFMVRLIIEFFKENQVAFEEDMILNMGQLLSIPFILAGIFLLVFSKKVLKI
jgi:prolipoprotein diacylglyceryl transferase